MATGGPGATRGGPAILRFERIAQGPEGLAVAVVGKDGSGIDDRILLRYGDDFEKPLTLSGGGESFTFSDCACVRVGRDQVVVSGPIAAMKVRAAGSPALLVDGKAVPASVRGGFLEMK